MQVLISLKYSKTAFGGGGRLFYFFFYSRAVLEIFSGLFGKQFLFGFMKDSEILKDIQ